MRKHKTLATNTSTFCCGILLLQDVERDEYGNIISCKMHDLALDVSTSYSTTTMLSHGINQVAKAISLRLEGLEDEYI